MLYALHPIKTVIVKMTDDIVIELLTIFS